MRVAEMLRERRRRYLEGTGLPLQELPRLLPPDYNGPPLRIAETLRLARERRVAMMEATGGTGDQQWKWLRDDSAGRAIFNQVARVW